MSRIIMKGKHQFLEITKVCNNCNKFTTVDEPILEGISRGSRNFYKNNSVDTCGNCGAAL